MPDEEPPDAPPSPTEPDRPADLDPAVILPRVRVHPLPPQGSGDDTAARSLGPERQVDGPSEQEKLHNQGLQQFYGMRLVWSRWLIGWVSCLIAFQILLAVAIGSGALDFRGYDTFLGLTVGQNFAQIVALALIVVRFLHSKSESDDPPL